MMSYGIYRAYMYRSIIYILYYILYLDLQRGINLCTCCVFLRTFCKLNARLESVKE